MSSKLDKLKKLLTEDEAAKSYCGALLMARVVDGKVHAANDCSVGEPAKITLLNLGDALKLDYSHECMEEADLTFSQPPSETTDALLDLIELMEDIPHYDDFTALEPSLPTLHLFLKLFRTKFRTLFDTAGADAPQETLNWLNIKKGYPADAHEIMNIFAKEALKVSDQYLPQPSNDSHADSEVNSEETIIITIHPSVTIYRELRDGFFMPTMAHLAIREYYVPGTNLAAVPVRFRPLFELNKIILNSFKIKVNETPSIEKLLTVDTLVNSGMTLKEAWVAASKLS